MLTHIDLFSGLGCWAIAARANGLRTLAFCEREEWLAAGLERTWQVPCHRDIKTFPAQDYAGRVWLLTGSPPCQPASLAGKRRGTADDRFLWPRTIQVCDIIKPAWFVFENVIGLDGVGLDGIISDLERIGYETTTLRIPACAVDSPQLRDRFWIVGNANAAKWRSNHETRGRCEQGINGQRQASSGHSEPTQGGAVGDCQTKRLQGVGTSGQQEPQSHVGDSPWQDYEWIKFNDAVYRAPVGLHDMADGVAHGIPKKFRAKLISALGNAIVWPVASQIIAAIVATSHPVASGKINTRG